MHRNQAPEIETDPWVYVSDIAREQGYDPSTIRDWIADGTLEGAEQAKPNGRWRIRRSAYEAWKRARQPQPTPVEAA